MGFRDLSRQLRVSDSLLKAISGIQEKKVKESDDEEEVKKEQDEKGEDDEEEDLSESREQLTQRVLSESEDLFSKEQLDKLRDEYGTMSRIDPASPSYRALIALLDNLPQRHIRQLAQAGIKFISPLAKNRLK